MKTSNVMLGTSDNDEVLLFSILSLSLNAFFIKEACKSEIFQVAVLFMGGTNTLLYLMAFPLP